MSENHSGPQPGQTGQTPSKSGQTGENVNSHSDLVFGAFTPKTQQTSGGQAQPSPSQPQPSASPAAVVPSGPQPPHPQGASPAGAQQVPPVIPGQYPVRPQPMAPAAAKVLASAVPPRTGSAPPNMEDTHHAQQPQAPHYIPQHMWMYPQGAPAFPPQYAGGQFAAGRGMPMQRMHGGPPVMMLPMGYPPHVFVPQGPGMHAPMHPQQLPPPQHVPPQTLPPATPPQVPQGSGVAAAPSSGTGGLSGLRAKLKMVAQAEEFRPDASAPGTPAAASVAAPVPQTPAATPAPQTPAATSQPSATGTPSAQQPATASKPRFIVEAAPFVPGQMPLPVSAPALEGAAKPSETAHPAATIPPAPVETMPPAPVVTPAAAATEAAKPAESPAAATEKPAATPTAAPSKDVTPPTQLAAPSPTPAAVPAAPAATVAPTATAAAKSPSPVPTAAAATAAATTAAAPSPTPTPATKPAATKPEPAQTAPEATAPVPQKSWRTARDEKQRSSEDMLSAYKPTPPPAPVSTQQPALPQKTPPTPVAAPSATSEDEEWERNLSNAPPVVPPSPVKKYTFDEMLELRPKYKNPPEGFQLLDGMKAVDLRPDRTAGRGGSGGMDRFDDRSGGDRRRGGDRGGKGGRGGRGDRDRGDRVGRYGSRGGEQTGPTEVLRPSETGYRVQKPTEEIEKIKRSVQGLLNKLTPEKFDKLYGQLLDIDINDRAMLIALIELVFKKAVDEPGFSPLYADLCVRLSEQRETNPDGTPMERLKFEFAPDEEGGKPITFKRLLLNRCQLMFESKAKPTDTAAAAKDDEAAFRERKTMLGNIKFIGELFKRRMLVPRIMLFCSNMLLERATTDTGAKPIESEHGFILPHEEMMEGLCKLLTTVGAMLDDPRTKCREQMDELFTTLKALMKNKELYSARIRFMIQDVIELRELQSWRPRVETAGPKKLDEIKRDLDSDSRVSRAAPPAKPAPPQQQRGGFTQVRPSSGGPGRASPAVPAATARAAFSQPARGGKEQMGYGGGRPVVRQSNAFGALADMSPDTTPEKPMPPPRAAKGATPQPPASPAPEVPPAPKEVAMTEEQAAKAGEQLIEEYMDTKLMDEAMQCVKDIQPSAMRKMVVESGLRWMLEQHDEQRIALANLFDHFAKTEVLSETNLAEGFSPLTGELDDLIIDYPNVLKYFAFFIARLLVSKSMPPQFLNDIMEEVEDSGRAPKLLAHTLQTLASESAPETAREIFEASKVHMDRLVPAAKYDAWVSDNNLSAIFGAGEKQQPDLSSMTVPDFFEHAFSQGTPAVSTLVEWVDKHAQGKQDAVMAAFAKKVMQEVMKRTAADTAAKPKVVLEQLLKTYEAVLKRLVQSTADAVVCLNAFVEAWADNGENKNFLQDLMWHLYDIDIVPEEAFDAWKADQHNASAAKATAIAQSEKFFKWLATATSGSDEEAPAS